MLKILLLIVIVVIIYLIFFKKKRVVGSSNKTDKNSRGDVDDSVSNDLIPCVQCGVLVPQSEAIISNGEFFCSENCMRK